MRTLRRQSPLTLTAIALSCVGVLLVLVDDSSRTALLTAIAVLVVLATRWRVAPIAAALLAVVMGALALSGHAPARDSRPVVAAQLPTHHVSPHAVPRRGRRP